MFGLLKKNQGEPEGEFVIARLNARVQPIDRGEYYEDPLDEALKRLNLGQVTGGGTQLADEPAGIEFCDVEIRISEANQNNVQSIIEQIESVGVPKGSRLIVERDGSEVSMGTQEGLGLFLNGTDLSDQVYEESDVNHVIEECDRLLADGGDFRGYWQGSRETALYFYGASFEDMKAAIEPFVLSYALCQKARVEQIA